MLTVIKSETYELLIKKSRFISYLFHIENLAEFDNFYKKLKLEHKKARHICYAYKLNDQIKYFDDGEPTKTAGMPILNAIEKNNLTNVVIFVVRYFGGILLGSGGLTRAYSNSAIEVINRANKTEVKKMKEIEVELTYEIYDIFINYLKDGHYKTTMTTFNDKINLSFLTDVDDVQDIESIFYPNLKIINETIKDIIVEGVE